MGLVRLTNKTDSNPFQEPRGKRKKNQVRISSIVVKFKTNASDPSRTTTSYTSEKPKKPHWPPNSSIFRTSKRRTDRNKVEKSNLSPHYAAYPASTS